MRSFTVALLAVAAPSAVCCRVSVMGSMLGSMFDGPGIAHGSPEIGGGDF